MGRPVLLGNGSLAVGINLYGLVHDFYYPYVGLDNLTTARTLRHKIGVWVNGRFSWVDDLTWEIHVDFDTDALVSSIRMWHEGLRVELNLVDFIDPELNAFYRRIKITNHGDTRRDVRLFLHQAFQISRAGRADTALFVPDDNYILDYKGRCCLLIYGQTDSGQHFDQFAVGNCGIEGKEGTFRDAEDGELSGSSVEHGGVDSVMRFAGEIESGGHRGIDYWIVAADSQFSAERIHKKILNDGVEARLNLTKKHWHEWLSIAEDGLRDVDKEYMDITKKSLMVIKAHTDKRGGIIASCDSSIYNYGRDYYSYVWPRDGAYAIWPLIRLGYTEEPKKFFEFCRDIMAPDGYLMHKYQPDRAIGSTWHPLLHGNHKELAIQEDETAVVVYMIGEYFLHSKDEEFVRSLYETFIKPAANFMKDFIDEQTNLPHASYDLWEMKFLTSTYTAAVTYQALLVAADFAEQFEYPDDAVSWRAAAKRIYGGAHAFFDPERQAYRKGFLLQPDGSLEFDNTLDVSSLYGVMIFGMHQPELEQVRATAKLIEEILLDSTPSGGVPRFENDGYFLSNHQYLGNPWIVTTLWMAQYYIRDKQPEKARHYVEWALLHSLPSGVMSEQVNPDNGFQVSVNPLVWSHAEFINTVLDLAKSK